MPRTWGRYLDAEAWRPGLLGKFLAALDAAGPLVGEPALTRLITRSIAPGRYTTCLVGTALLSSATKLTPCGLRCQTVEENYDLACVRFGNERVNAAIRERVLKLQAARRAARAPVVTAVEPEKEKVTV